MCSTIDEDSNDNASKVENVWLDRTGSCGSLGVAKSYSFTELANQTPSALRIIGFNSIEVLMIPQLGNNELLEVSIEFLCH